MATRNLRASSVVDAWADLLLKTIVAAPSSMVLSRSPRRNRVQSTHAAMLKIADQLFKTATLAAVVPRMQISYSDLAGGNTAAMVSVATTHSQFVFKADYDAKLLREARVIDELRRDARLGAFSFRLPEVYAVWAEGPPYAYVMEFFDATEYQSLKQLLFGGETTARSAPGAHSDDLVEAALLALREAYLASRDDRQQVRIMSEAYYRRIADGLAAAATADERFASRSLIINDRLVPPWRRMLQNLASAEAFLQQIAAPFVTVVHGDPNPGNILIQQRKGRVTDVKFIDLKDWRYGDYIFDIAKLTHFILYTGPLEELRIFTSPLVHKKKKATTITYTAREPNPAASAVTVAERHAADVARELGDRYWRERYELAIASNLLGLVPRRLRTGAVDDATILYASGLLHLHSFLQGVPLLD